MCRQRFWKTPCRLHETLFSSSESHRELKGVGIRSCCQQACNFTRALETVILKNVPHENYQSRLEIGKPLKHPEVRQSILIHFVYTIFLAWSGFEIKNYGNYRFDVAYVISLQNLLHRKQCLITLKLYAINHRERCLQDFRQSCQTLPPLKTPEFSLILFREPWGQVSHVITYIPNA